MRKYLTLIFCVLCLTGMCGIVKSSLGAKGIEYIGKEGATPIPEGLIAIEYIEGTGTQWLNSGYGFNQDTDKIEITIQVTGVVQYGYAFGVNQDFGSGVQFGGVRRNSTLAQWFLFSSSPLRFDLIDGEIYRIGYAKLAAGGGYVNGSSSNIGVGNHLNYTLPVFILACNNRGEPGIINQARLYAYSHIREGVYVLKMVPVRFINENEEDEGAMYDFVSGELFRNQGTGSFVIGPDKQ